MWGDGRYVGPRNRGGRTCYGQNVLHERRIKKWGKKPQTLDPPFEPFFFYTFPI